MENIRQLAHSGDMHAQQVLGRFYGNRKHFQEALKWYRLAAQQGDVDALYNLGVMYSNGIGVRQDYQIAEELFSHLSNQNYVPAIFNLGAIYYIGGDEEEQNYTQAFEGHKKASELGYEKSLIAIQ